MMRRRSQDGASLPAAATEASGQAAVEPLSKRQQGEAARLGFQKTAAWQRLLRGAGADQALHDEAYILGKAIARPAGSRRTSRFADQAPVIAQTSRCPSFDTVDIARPRNVPPRPPPRLVSTLSEAEASCGHLKTACENEEKKISVKASNDRDKKHRLLLGFPKLLSIFRRNRNLASSQPAVYHTHVYHLHHHYYPGDCNSFVEEVSLDEQPHLRAPCRQRFRYSESGLHHPLPYPKFSQAAFEEDNSRMQRKHGHRKSDHSTSLRYSSRQEAWHTLRDFDDDQDVTEETSVGEDEVVIEQLMNNYLPPPREVKVLSDRFETKIAESWNGRDDRHRQFGGSSISHRRLSLQERSSWGGLRPRHFTESDTGLSPNVPAPKWRHRSGRHSVDLTSFPL